MTRVICDGRVSACPVLGRCGGAGVAFSRGLSWGPWAVVWCGMAFGDRYWESGQRENYSRIEGVSTSLGCA